MKVLLNRNVEKTLNKMRKKNSIIFKQINKTICEIAQNSYSNKYENVVKYPIYKRACSGKYRVYFRILDNSCIYIARIDKRSRVYV